jgi:hypothetical protein
MGRELNRPIHDDAEFVGPSLGRGGQGFVCRGENGSIESGSDAEPNALPRLNGKNRGDGTDRVIQA